MNIKEMIADIYPLSPMQEGMLFHTLYAPGSGVYLLQMKCRLRGDVDVAALKKAWRRALERHAVLRTAFAWENIEKPMQVVFQTAEVPFDAKDWRGLDAAECRKRREAFLDEDRSRGFDLAKPPLLRLTMLSMGEDEHELIVTYHHVVLDAWSGTPLVAEVFADYAALCQGRELHPPKRRPFRDYIAWLQKKDLSRAEAFWRRQLAGIYTPTLIPSDRPPGREPSSSQAYDMVSLPVGTRLTEQLKSLVRQHQVTLNVLAQCAWSILLHRYNGDRDLLFGVVTSGRPTDLPGAESMVGLFINTLPMRATIRPETTLQELWRALQARQVEVQEYEYTPLLQIQGWSEMPRGQSLFESIYCFLNTPGVEEMADSLQGLKVEQVDTTERTSYPLTVEVRSLEELEVHVFYELDRFDPTSVQRIMRHYRAVLEGMVDGADRRPHELFALTPGECHQAVFEWNDTAAELPPACLHRLFEAQIGRRDASVALLHGKVHVSYLELNRRANRLAHYLLDLGVGPEVRVALCLERGPDTLVAILAILKAGGAYIALDPAYPQQRIAFMLEDAGVLALLTQRSLLPLLGSPPTRVACLDAADFELGDPALGERGPASGVRPLDLAYVLYTSGSTGRPKGVAISHAAASNLIQWAPELLAPEDFAGLAAATSVCFDVSVFEFFATLAAGGRIVLVANVLDLAQRPVPEARFLCAVPSAIEEMVELGLAPSLCRFFLGGEALSQRLVRRLYEEPTVDHVIDGYGPSEDTTYTTRGLRARHGQGPASIGRPIANKKVHVVDRRLSPQPIGMTGELTIGGVGLARCYLERPGLSAERFVPDPFTLTAGRRLYRTGDLARLLADGRLAFLGRGDHQIKIRGFRIELGEIEAAILSHPAVRQAAVTVHRQDSGEKRLVGYAVAHSEAPSIAEIQELLSRRLPEFMVPSVFLFVDQLPTTPSGKLDRKALPKPEGERPELEVDYVAPRNELERQLAEVWAKALGIDKVGTQDNFFDVGGHSLAMVNIVGKLRKELGLKIEIVEAFRYPTIQDVASFLSQQSTGPTAAEHRQHVATELARGKQRLQQRRQRRRQTPAVERAR